jgi:hypothetical protein
VAIGGFVDEVNQTALEPHLLRRGLHSLLSIQAEGAIQGYPLFCGGWVILSHWDSAAWA